MIGIRDIAPRAVTALLVVLIWQAAVSSVRAEEAKAPVFAIIDVQKVLRDSTAVKALTRRTQEEREKYQGELRKKEETLRNASQELTRQRSILSAEAYASKRSELEQQVATLQREVQERKRGLDRAFGKGMAKVKSELAEIAKEIAEEKGLDMILSKAAIVIVKPAFEITNVTLKRLNERLPDIPPSSAQN